jgi:hypothetical protein
VVGVDGAQDPRAVAVLEVVERQGGVPDQPTAVVRQPEAGVRAFPSPVVTLEEEGLGRVVAQGHAVERRVVDHREPAGGGEVEVGHVDPLNVAAHTATRCR